MDPLHFLKSASERFVAECAKANQGQWTHASPGGGWSMGHVAEHVTIANQNFAARLKNLSPLAGTKPDVIDDEVPYLFYRGDEPPNVATPSGDWTSWNEHSAEYEQSVADILNWRSPVELRSVGARHPIFGTLDGVQWLMFAGAHTERHRAQLIWLLREASG
jgi:uncharacterized damage-inducible protein DinB